MTKKIFYTALAVLALAGCAKELPLGENPGDSQESSSYTTFYASVEDAMAPDAKTSLLDVEGDRFIRWSQDDEIGIYGGTSTQNSVGYLDEDSAGQTKGMFIASGKFESPRFAYYPYTLGVYYVNDCIEGVEIPAHQTYEPGKVFDSTVCPMVGMYNNATSTFEFRNAASVIEIQLTGEEKVTKVELRSLDKAIAGKGKLSVGDEPEFIPDDNSEEAVFAVSLTLKEPVQLTATPTPFYFVVAPRSYGNLMVYVETENGNAYHKASTTSHSAQARHILPIKQLQAGKPDTASSTDLTGGGRYANTFLLKPDQVGMFSFDAKYVDGTPVEGGVSADCLWESEGGLVGDYFYDAATQKVYFSKNKVAAGSALICLFDGEGKVVWSWTIWASDVKDQTWGADGQRYTFMDRNLGATWVPTEAMETSSTASDYNPDLDLSAGFHYQYGRPVPSPGPSTLNCTVRYEGFGPKENGGWPMGAQNIDGYTYSQHCLDYWTWKPVFHRFREGYTDGWRARNAKLSFDQMRAFPLDFNKIVTAVDDGSKNYLAAWATDVVVTGQNAAWKEQKTNNDPCPAGYRVPMLKEMRNFINDGNGALSFTNNELWAGGYIQREGNFIWIPKAGIRVANSNQAANSYSISIAYWGNWKHSGAPWYVGNGVFWGVNPDDVQSDLAGAKSWGGWACPATHDIYARILHFANTNMLEDYADGKPYVSPSGDACSVRCIKIQ